MNTASKFSPSSRERADLATSAVPFRYVVLEGGSNASAADDDAPGAFAFPGAEGVPLVPIPELSESASSAAPFRGAAPTPASRAGGGVKKAIGMAVICALLALAVMLVFRELSPVDSPVFVSANASSVAGIESPSPVAALAPLADATASVVVVPVMEEGTGGPVGPSPAFIGFVAKMRVSGVSLGASPRALINGRMVHVGDLLDPVSGASFAGVDIDARELILTDVSRMQLRFRY